MGAFQPIKTNRGTIASLEEAIEFINTYIPNAKRSEPQWDSAIADINAAIMDLSRTAAARDRLHKALSECPPAIVTLI
jgi:hypothetical protein